MTNRSQKPAIATYGLICANLLTFGVEIWMGGSQNLETLYAMGALIPQAVWAGQWWRIVSANFLHYGWLHLAANMLGLAILGTTVERLLGMQRYLLVYFVSGVGSMLAFSAIALGQAEVIQVVVGASAGIMGLFGVLGARLLQGWRKERTAIAAERLRMAGVILGLQFAFDLLLPQVSFLSHLFGAILGFLLGASL